MFLLATDGDWNSDPQLVKMQRISDHEVTNPSTYTAKAIPTPRTQEIDGRKARNILRARKPEGLL